METKSKHFPFYRFEGTDRQIGQQFGEACKDLILLHRDYALERLQKNVKLPSLQALEEAALQYRPYVLQFAPFFDEQVQGISEGAGLSLGQAYFLQLRAEIYHEFDSTDECTTFAVCEEATQNGVPLIGQNADLPAFYSK
jgi:isopenicillin-N N-acyltransferase-like protein